MNQHEPNPPHTEAELFFVDPATLQQLADNAPMTWAEIMNDGKVGNDEFVLFLKLSEPANLSMPEVILLYLYYWEKKTEPELEEMYNIPNQRISDMIREGKEKLYPHLKGFLRNKKLA